MPEMVRRVQVLRQMHNPEYMSWRINDLMQKVRARGIDKILGGTVFLAARASLEQASGGEVC
jgi:hypothetical protein